MQNDSMQYRSYRPILYYGLLIFWTVFKPIKSFYAKVIDVFDWIAETITY